MNSKWVAAQQRKLDEKITAEYIAATSPQSPDDDWIYELHKAPQPLTSSSLIKGNGSCFNKTAGTS